LFLKLHHLNARYVFGKPHRPAGSPPLRKPEREIWYVNHIRKAFYHIRWRLIVLGKWIKQRYESGFIAHNDLSIAV